METNTIQTKKPGIPGSTLKIIAIITMFIDHLAASLIELHMPMDSPASPWFITDIIMRLIGRLGFPLFVFLLVEGSHYTKNKVNYLRNMLIFALVSEIPFDLALVSGHVWDFSHQNVFFTLLFGLCFIFLSDYVKEKEEPAAIFKIIGKMGFVFAFLVFCQAFYNSEFGYSFAMFGKSIGIIGSVIAGATAALLYFLFSMRWDENKKIWLGNAYLFLGIFMGIADLLNTDYSGWGVLVIAIMYFLRGNVTNKKEAAMGCLGLTLMQSIECTSFFTLIPISKYNGERGLKLKYFFYLFYPVHLTIIYLIGLLIFR